MVYFKPGAINENDVFLQRVTQANSEKEIPSATIRSRTQDLPITGLDALPLSFRYNITLRMSHIDIPILAV